MLLHPLSPRQERILTYLMAGMKNKEIAEGLGVSIDVVKKEIRMMFDAAGVWNRVELAMWHLRRQNGGV